MEGYYWKDIRVFLLDDHDIVRKGLRDLLMGHRDIFLVADSDSAVRAPELIVKLRPDVMVLDLQLQDGSGIDVCRRVRSADPSIRGLLLTSAGDDEALIATVLGGADGYVVKLARSDHILSAIRRIGAGATLLTEPDRQRATRLIQAALQEGEPSTSDDDSRRLAYVMDGLTNGQIAERESALEEHVALQMAEFAERVTHPWRAGQ